MLSNNYNEELPVNNYSKNKKSEREKNIVFAYIIILFVSNIIGFISFFASRIYLKLYSIQEYTYFQAKLGIVLNILSVFFNLALLLLPFAIKKKSLRIIAFVLVSIIIIYHLINNIISFISNLNILSSSL